MATQEQQQLSSSVETQLWDLILMYIHNTGILRNWPTGDIRKPYFLVVPTFLCPPLRDLWIVMPPWLFLLKEPSLSLYLFQSTGIRTIFILFLIECLGDGRGATALWRHSWLHVSDFFFPFLLALTTWISFSIALSIFLPLTHNLLHTTCLVQQQGNIWSNCIFV